MRLGGDGQGGLIRQQKSPTVFTVGLKTYLIFLVAQHYHDTGSGYFRQINPCRRKLTRSLRFRVDRQWPFSATQLLLGFQTQITSVKHQVLWYQMIVDFRRIDWVTLQLNTRQFYLRRFRSKSVVSVITATTLKLTHLERICHLTCNSVSRPRAVGGQPLTSKSRTDSRKDTSLEYAGLRVWHTSSRLGDIGVPSYRRANRSTLRCQLNLTLTVGLGPATIQGQGFVPFQELIRGLQCVNWVGISAIGYLSIATPQDWNYMSQRLLQSAIVNYSMAINQCRLVIVFTTTQRGLNELFTSQFYTFGIVFAIPVNTVQNTAVFRAASLC